MKLTSLLSAAAVLGLGVSLLAGSLNIQSLGAFAITTSVLFLLAVVRDYAPRRAYWQPSSGHVVRFPTRPAQVNQQMAA